MSEPKKQINSTPKSILKKKKTMKRIDKISENSPLNIDGNTTPNGIKSKKVSFTIPDELFGLRGKSDFTRTPARRSHTKRELTSNEISNNIKRSPKPLNYIPLLLKQQKISTKLTPQLKNNRAYKVMKRHRLLKRNEKSLLSMIKNKNNISTNITKNNNNNKSSNNINGSNKIVPFKGRGHRAVQMVLNKKINDDSIDDSMDEDEKEVNSNNNSDDFSPESILSEFDDEMKEELKIEQIYCNNNHCLIKLIRNNNDDIKCNKCGNIVGIEVEYFNCKECNYNCHKICSSNDNDKSIENVTTKFYGLFTNTKRSVGIQSQIMTVDIGIQYENNDRNNDKNIKLNNDITKNGFTVITSNGNKYVRMNSVNGKRKFNKIINSNNDNNDISSNKKQKLNHKYKEYELVEMYGTKDNKIALIYPCNDDFGYYNIYWLNYDNKNNIYKTIEHVSCIKCVLNEDNIPKLLTKISLKSLLFLKSKRNDIYNKLKGTFDRLQNELL